MSNFTANLTKNDFLSFLSTFLIISTKNDQKRKILDILPHFVRQDPFPLIDATHPKFPHQPHPQKGTPDFYSRIM